MQDSAFDDFWRASELDRYSVADFARKMASFDGSNTPKYLEYPASATQLPSKRTSLVKISSKRTSTRSFTTSPLENKDIATILSAFRAYGDVEHRSFPAAGALYSVEVFHILFNANDMTGKILYYHPKNHGYVELQQSAPQWGEAVDALNIEVNGVPQSLILFVVFPERLMQKYGERGGRFMLLEAGAAMQQLSLTIASTNGRLKGVPVGGTIDNYWLRVLGLADTNARIAIGYLVGR